ncbi:hypothetical protein BC834DRAFT_920740 [Gloeopeniophorella convolvens]|nr:hypothetical protein BC834DRAFT_920740 [Gloeopeniophorella convolvens]
MPQVRPFRPFPPLLACCMSSLQASELSTRGNTALWRQARPRPSYAVVTVETGVNFSNLIKRAVELLDAEGFSPPTNLTLTSPPSPSVHLSPSASLTRPQLPDPLASPTLEYPPTSLASPALQLPDPANDGTGALKATAYPVRLRAKLDALASAALFTVDVDSPRVLSGSQKRRRNRRKNAQAKQRARISEACSQEADPTNALALSPDAAFPAREGAKRAADTAESSPLQKRHRVVGPDLHDEPTSTAIEGSQDNSNGLNLDDCGELDSTGFRYFCWDGATPHVLLDDERRIIVALIGPPKDGDGIAEERSWAAVVGRAAALFERLWATASSSAFIGESKNPMRKGDSASIPFGISCSGGQESEPEPSVSGALLSSEEVRRIAGFQSSVLAHYYPLAYQHLRQSMFPLREASDLSFNFDNSIYPAATANIGPQTVSLDHNDSSYYTGLPCAVTSMGTFNPDHGGHLVLQDLKLKVKFPPGSTVLLPSTWLRYGNTPVGEGERRYSFMQYCPDSLLRWARYGLKPMTYDSKQCVAASSSSDGWDVQLSRFSRLEEREKQYRCCLHP